MSETVSIDAREWAELQARAARLAREKSSLQLAVHLMGRLSKAAGLAGTLQTMLRSVLEVIGGTQAAVYYWIDDKPRFANVLGVERELEAVADALVLQVIAQRLPLEQEGAFSETLLTTQPFTTARTWAFPLLVGSELVGVLKLEGIHMGAAEIQEALPAFLDHAALALRQEVQSHTRLAKAYAELKREVAEREQAELGLRKAKESLEDQVAARTQELQLANERLVAELAERRALQQKLRVSEQLYRQLVETSPEGVIISDLAGSLRFVSAPARSVLGLPAAAVTGRSLLDWVATDQRPAVVRQLAEAAADQAALPQGVYPFARHDGTVFWGELLSKSVPGSEGGADEVLSLLRDITAQREAEAKLKESEAYYKGIFEEHAAVKLLIEPNTGAILDANRAASDYYGWSRDQLRQMRIQDINTLVPAELAGEMEATHRRQRSYFEFRHRRADGSVRDVAVFSSATRVHGQPALHSIVQDISERKRAEAALKEALTRATGLLKEVHHRVKNNLQLVVSLLNLQARQLKHPAAVEALRDTQSRIRSLALLHETLHRGTDVEWVNAASYFTHLCRHLDRSFSPAGGRIALDLQLAPIQLDIDTAIPGGLIVNELVSNAYKHAFPDGRPGKIRVCFRRESEVLMVLEVIDDGVGLPPGWDWRQRDSLGLTMVATLARQIRAEVTVKTSPGTQFQLRFPQKANPVAPTMGSPESPFPVTPKA